jgi:opacity protein-like surface antigen
MRIFSILCVLFFASPSFAGGTSNKSLFFKKYYVGFHGGYSYTLAPNTKFTASSTEDAGQFGVMLGGELSNNWRVELETNYNTKFKAEIPTGLRTEQEFESFAGLVNVYKFWNFQNSDQVQPFVMGGVGVAYNMSGDYKSFDNAGALTSHIVGNEMIQPTYQFGTGVALKINDSSYFDFSLRYLNRGKADTTNTQVDSSGNVTTAVKEEATIRNVLGLVSVRIIL